MYQAITTTNLVQLCFILLISLFIDRTSAVAGYCYQCNSRNPSCGMDVSATLRIDGTPCNGQCYARINRDDGNTIYRGCSWEHGFMTPQQPNTILLQGNSVWIFCDTPYCNVEATGLLNSVCYQPICNFLKFPEDCSLPNADITCGRFCGNVLCGSSPLPRFQQLMQHNRKRNPNQKPKPIRNRNHTRRHKRNRKNSVLKSKI